MLGQSHQCGKEQAEKDTIPGTKHFYIWFQANRLGRLFECQIRGFEIEPICDGD